ncbi:MAG: hypothetical protein ACLUOI_19885 [Eisenbergiella sp.]
MRVYDKIDWCAANSPSQAGNKSHYLPDNENNLGYVTEGVEIKMKKFIPVAAGIGEEAVMRRLSVRVKDVSLGLTTEQLMERGVKLGADVPYCIMRGTALSEGIGEILRRCLRCRGADLIAKPPISVSAKFVMKT